MTSRYNSPTIDANFEDRERQSRIYRMSSDVERDTAMAPRRQENRYDPAVILTRTSSDRQREKTRRSHRNVTNTSNSSSSSVSRSSNRAKARISSSRYHVPSSREESYGSTRQRQRHTRSPRSGDSSSSSSGEDEVIEDHRVVLAAARASLTSPSLISNLTSLTTATNNSGSSSGSNSTVTQASLSKSLVPKEIIEPNGEVPISPAVPDPPDVFSFLEQDSPDEDEDEDEDALEDEDATPQAEADPQWLSDGIYDSSPLSRHVSLPNHESMSSSSASSSFHSDEGSEPIADNDTDRSTSPERSVKGEDDTASTQPDRLSRNDPAASKLASQMLAAQHRQSMHGAFQSFGSPQMACGMAAAPHAPSKALSPRLAPHMQQHAVPRAEQIPITGYEAIASKLSNHSARSPSIKPIYRKFERLNHRLLLHLQDELAELEEQLHMLDNADTKSRSGFDASGKDVHVFPASRRAGAQLAHMGGELEWHKMDLINKIAYKLAQYNQALTSFNKLTQELDLPDLEAVKKYRHFLHNEKPVIENETKFLDATGDLVVLGWKSPRAGDVERQGVSQPRKVRFEGEVSPQRTTPSPQLRIIAVAVAAAVLIPILTFAVIPGFLGRLTVVLLVAMATLGLMFQSGIAGRDLLGNVEWASCAVTYAGVMVIVAAIFA